MRTRGVRMQYRRRWLFVPVCWNVRKSLQQTLVWVGVSLVFGACGGPRIIAEQSRPERLMVKAPEVSPAGAPIGGRVGCIVEIQPDVAAETESLRITLLSALNQTMKDSGLFESVLEPGFQPTNADAIIRLVVVEAREISQISRGAYGTVTYHSSEANIATLMELRSADDTVLIGLPQRISEQRVAPFAAPGEAMSGAFSKSFPAFVTTIKSKSQELAGRIGGPDGIASSSGATSSLRDKLLLIDRLREQNLISETEYLERRAQILGIPMRDSDVPALPPAIPSVQGSEVVVGQVDGALEEAVKGERWLALLIGISEYQNPSFAPTLNTPTNDVRAIGAILRSDFGFSQVEVLENEAATRKGILSALEALAEKTLMDDNVLVYFAGHGARRSNGGGYWIPQDATDEFDAIQNEVILSSLVHMKARRVLLVSDSCFAGSFLTRSVDSERSIGRPISEGASLATWRQVVGNKYASREVLTSGELAPVMDEGVGMFSGHSPFAGAFLNTLRSLPVGGVATSLDVHVDVYKQVTSMTGSGQQPRLDTINQGDAGGKFFLIRRSKNPSE